MSRGEPMKEVNSNIIVVSQDSNRLSLLMSIIQKHCQCCKIYYCFEMWDIYEIIASWQAKGITNVPVLVIADMKCHKIREDFSKLEEVRHSLPELGMVIVPLIEEKKVRLEDWPFIRRSRELVFTLAAFTQEELRLAIRSVMKMWLEALRWDDKIYPPVEQAA
jgi:hypothetical protein